MVRNPLKKADKKEEAPTEETKEDPKLQIVEREINLILINDKINYIMSVLEKIAEACEVDLTKE